MDYVVGSVAALISGNVTPNRPKVSKKAFTPIKHQPSPNVTPKGETLVDRSIFISPTMQKKKAIVKKSPKRIFQNQELNVTNNEDGDDSHKSPNADKVKKHLKNELDRDGMVSQILLSPKSPKSPKNKGKNFEGKLSKKKLEVDDTETIMAISPKKKKQRKSVSASEEVELFKDNSAIESDHEKENMSNTGPLEKTKKKKSKFVGETDISNSSEKLNPTSVKNKGTKKNKKQHNNEIEKNVENTNHSANTEATGIKNSKKKKNKKSKQKKVNDDKELKDNETLDTPENIKINPNAVTNNDSESEHDSDDEIESENEEINKETLNTGATEESSDDEHDEQVKKKEAFKYTPPTEDVIKRTLFVGNVPFSSKCKKEIKKIFSQYGKIKTVRIRNIPVKDPRTTPKMAVIKKELHPNRTNVNVYVKYAEAESVDKALEANNTVLNGYHLRVSRSNTTGEIHDPKHSVFVGNIPFALEEEALRAKFEKCGEVDSVRIIRDRKTNAGKGFGYVNFKSRDGVELALALAEEDLTIKNRILRVKRCTQTTQKKPDRGENFQNKFQGNRDTGKQFVQRKFSGGKVGEKSDGAYRRIANKRKPQDGGDGPPDKKRFLNQPNQEKKSRKEFVGMTAEKKKKHKFSKGQKKKKVLSEILTKK